MPTLRCQIYSNARNAELSTLTENLTSNTDASITDAMTITTKGQVTIPLPLRELYGLLPGTQVEFVPDGDSLRVQAIKKKSKNQEFDAWLNLAAGCTKTNLTTDEILNLTRGEN